MTTAMIPVARDVDARTRAEPRVRSLEAELEAATPGEQSGLRGRLQELTDAVRSQKLGEDAVLPDRCGRAGHPAVA